MSSPQTFEYDDEDPPGFRSGMANVGKAAGGTDQAVKLFELPPGESLCPYHYEYEEEWLLVLDGKRVSARPTASTSSPPATSCASPRARTARTGSPRRRTRQHAC